VSHIITLPIYDIVITLNPEGTGEITSKIKEQLPLPDEALSHYLEGIADGIETMILSFASEGFDVETQAFLDVIENAVNLI